VVAVGADAGAAAAVAHQRQLVDRKRLTAEAARARGDERLQLGGGGARGGAGRGRLEDVQLGLLADPPIRAGAGRKARPAASSTRPPSWLARTPAGK
jgi:hypothetical protein